MKKLVKLRLNKFSHTDYFNDVFTTFLALESGNYVAGYYGGVRKLLDFIKKNSSFIIRLWSNINDINDKGELLMTKMLIFR